MARPIIGIVGARRIEPDSAYRTMLSVIKQTHATCRGVVSGGAEGIDALAERWAYNNDVPLRVFKPEYKHSRDRTAPLKRNTLIADACDILYAFPTSESRGTYDTIRKAEQMGKQVIVTKLLTPIELTQVRDEQIARLDFELSEARDSLAECAHAFGCETAEFAHRRLLNEEEAACLRACAWKARDKLDDLQETGDSEIHDLLMEIAAIMGYEGSVHELVPYVRKLYDGSDCD